MVFGSVERLFVPQPIHYREAIVVAIVGLVVNVVSARILGHAIYRRTPQAGAPGRVMRVSRQGPTVAP
jgi:hypothetical protein